MIYTLTLNPALDRELTVPRLTFDEVLRSSASRADCGGKGFNVSRMLANLGAASTALGFAGGHTGAMLRDGLAALQIATEFVWVAGETRTNISIVASDDHRHIKVNEPGPTISAEEQQALVALVKAKAAPGDWWVLAGSLPPGCSPNFYANLIALIQGAGAHALLDTSGVALRYGCAAAPFLVKPNAAEASELTGLPVRTVSEARQAAEALGTIAYVALSMGADGALLTHQRRAWHATSPQIHQANPIGAGDSMLAGLTWSLSQGHDAATALRWGVACGAATASLSGTAVGTSEQVAQLFEQVDVQEL
jgi:1-phosphofructokinase family hexose kinase